jgi:pyrroline-5-carboxylate reductase
MKIALLGTGNMGKAILAGLRQKYGKEIDIVAFDKNPAALAGIEGAAQVGEPATWFTGASLPDAVIVAVKPFDLAAALESLVKSCGGSLIHPLWISIAAGKNIAALRKVLPEGARICRVMPNTPALIGEGMSAFALSDNACEEDARLVERIFQACGKIVAVPEKMMNAVTGLSGSGPAYVFFFIESLVEAGVIAGLPLAVARECAMQTVVGAAKMASVSTDGLSDLQMKVMTPAGTTASAMNVFEQHAVKNAVIKAVVAATRRAQQLES